MAKNSFNDKNTFKNLKGGSSNSKLDFLKGGMDFLDKELEDSNETENISQEELDDPELAIEIDQESIEEELLTVEEEEVSQKLDETKSGKVTVITRKVSVKKPPVADKIVDKDVKDLVKKLVKDVNIEDVRSINNVSKKQKDQMLSGNMSFLGRSNASIEEKKEFLSKLDEITSSEDITNANASFVMKWLKNRK
ncbi:MAG: hypothetical protein U0354_01440 [Candidatus Sericytochromatia bacterium]